MKNFLNPGKVVEFLAPYTVSSGGGAKVGSKFVVAKSDVTSGASGEGMTRGRYSLTKTSAQAWSEGDPIYWDDTNKRCDNTNVGMLVGIATEAAANPSSTGNVLLIGECLPQGVHVATVATANATDLATSEALANQLKTTLNALITSMQNAGQLASS